MQSIDVRYVGGPMDDRVLPVTGPGKPPILNARSFTEADREWIALYARAEDQGTYCYQFVNRYPADEWREQEKHFVSSLAATRLPWEKD